MHGINGHTFYFYICHYVSLETTRYIKQLDKWVVLLGGYAVVHHPFRSPNGPLQVETMSQYFTGIFNLYIGTMFILFRPHVHVVW